MVLLSLYHHAAAMQGIINFFEQIETLQAIILILGLLLLIVEIFAPGFGIAGGAGITLYVIGIFLTADTFFEGMLMFAILIMIVAIVLTVILRSAKKGRLSRILVLQSSAKKEDGYSSANDSTSLIGKTGKAMTQLRPSGMGDFDGIRLDIVSEGDYIDKGSEIRIVSSQGRRIVVEAVRSESIMEPDHP